MAISERELRNLLEAHFPGDEIEIKDLVGDNDHYELIIKSSLFINKSKIEQHRMVNNALKDCLGGKLHALSIKTITK